MSRPEPPESVWGTLWALAASSAPLAEGTTEVLGLAPTVAPALVEDDADGEEAEVFAEAEAPADALVEATVPPRPEVVPPGGAGVVGRAAPVVRWGATVVERGAAAVGLGFAVDGLGAIVVVFGVDVARVGAGAGDAGLTDGAAPEPNRKPIDDPGAGS